MRRLACAPLIAPALGLALLTASAAPRPGPAFRRAGAMTRTPPMPAAAPPNAYYTGNRDPLLPSPFVKLPIGSIRPEGWLRYQLERMADGMTGHLPEVSHWARFEGCAWADKNGRGANGWEELPYWLKGYTDLGYVLGDRRIIAGAERWIDAILAGQRPDGWFGPESNREKPDLWPNMVALYALRSHYEATGDRRVLKLMAGYFRWQAKLPLERYLPDDWQKWRGGDNLDSIYWLYNRTGGSWLLDLARVTHERTADWVGGIPTWHGVNICQGFREPAEYFQQTRDARYLHATERDYDTVLDRYGQVPGGMFGADENARPGYYGPRQGAETCSMVEMMFSHEMLLSITGDAKWADRCEEVAFNSLPAAMTPDLKGLHYLTAPNQVQLDRQSKAPMIENGGDMFSYSPDERYRCCQHNVAFGWPYFAEHLWMATPGNGLAAVLYAPCSVSARVGDGAKVTVQEATGYPFDDTITLTLKTPRPAQFPLRLRVPGWCDAPKVSLDGAPMRVRAARGWITLDRIWKEGDAVRLQLPMSVRVKVWAKNRHTVSVYRGPLAYSLKIGERWQQVNPGEKWPNWEVYATTPWNVGLVLDAKDPAASFEVVKAYGAADAQVFTPDAPPIVLQARGKRIPAWKQEANGLIQEVQNSPVRSSEPVEEVTLIPMGCARLRISAFPQIGEGESALDARARTAVRRAEHGHP